MQDLLTSFGLQLSINNLLKNHFVIDWFSLMFLCLPLILITSSVKIILSVIGWLLRHQIEVKQNLLFVVIGRRPERQSRSTAMTRWIPDWIQINPDFKRTAVPIIFSAIIWNARFRGWSGWEVRPVRSFRVVEPCGDTQWLVIHLCWVIVIGYLGAS